MKKIVVKIGADMLKDMGKLGNPKNVDKFPDSVVYFKSMGQFTTILSAKKLELLKYLSEVTGQTVTKVAIELGRKKEAISRDLHQLESLGFVKLHKQGKNTFPKVSYDAIQINLRAST